MSYVFVSIEENDHFISSKHSRLKKCSSMKSIKTHFFGGMQILMQTQKLAENVTDAQSAMV